MAAVASHDVARDHLQTELHLLPGFLLPRNLTEEEEGRGKREEKEEEEEEEEEGRAHC